MLTWVYVHVWYTGQTQSIQVWHCIKIIGRSWYKKPQQQYNPKGETKEQKLGQHELPSGFTSPAPFMVPILRQLR